MPNPKLITTGRHGKNGIPRPPKPKPGGIEGKILLPGENGYHGRPRNIGVEVADITLRNNREVANDKYRLGLGTLAAGGTAAAGGSMVGAGYWYKGKRDKAALRRKHGLDPVQKKLKIKMPKFEAPSNHVLGEYVDTSAGSLRRAHTNRKGVPAVTSMPPKKTVRERAARFAYDNEDVPVVAGSLLGSAAATAGIMSWSKDNRRAKGQVAAHKRRQNQLKAKQQAMAKADSNFRRNAETGALGTAGLAGLGVGMGAKRITHAGNQRYIRGLDQQISRASSDYGLDSKGRSVPKLQMSPDDNKRYGERIRGAKSAAERNTILQEKKDYNTRLGRKNSVRRERRQTFIADKGRLKNVERFGPRSRTALRAGGFGVGAAALYAAGSRHIEKYDRRDLNSATAGSVAGGAAFGGFARADYLRDRKKRDAVYAKNPKLAEELAEHKRKSGLRPNAFPDDPAWNKVWAKLPKHHPMARKARMATRVYSGPGMFVAGGAAALAGGTGAVALDRKVRKNLYVRERRTDPARVVQFGAGAGLLAAGLGRSGIVGRALGQGIKMATTKGNVQAVEALQRAQAARGVLRAGVRPAEHHLRQIRQVDRAVRAVPAPLRGDVALGAGLLLTANSFPMRQTTYRQTGYPATIRRY